MQLAEGAGVGRQRLVAVEKGHDRAELGKVGALLGALDLQLTSRPAAPPADPARTWQADLRALASYRPGKDQADLELLFARLDIRTAEQAADMALAVYGEYSVVLPGRDELLLSAQAILDRRHGSRGRRPAR